MKYVEVLPAYEWACLKCGAVNFSRSKPTPVENLLPGVREAMTDPLYPFEAGEMVLCTPSEVTCKECKETFVPFMECHPVFEDHPTPDDWTPDEDEEEE